jgi:hypothetical protein
MLHARIAARAFNTPLLVEPSKAMAFLSGLGPRILGRRVEIGDGTGALESTVVRPARASILAGEMLDDYRQHGEAPYPVVDGIAVRLCCTNPMRDSSCESSVVAGLHEQTHISRLQDQELARIQ